MIIGKISILFRMPYPEFTGFTKDEISDLKAVVKEFGDVDISGWM